MSSKPTVSVGWRWLVFLLLAGFMFGGLFILVKFPQLAFSSVHIYYQQGTDWVEVPRLGEPSYALRVSTEGELWGMNPAGVYRWHENAWQNIHVPNAHPVDFDLDNKAVWIVMHAAIERCDFFTLECTEEYPIDHGFNIAAWDGQVYAINGAGLLVWYDGFEWHQDNVSNLLPDFQPDFREGLPDLVFTDDGTLWLRWFRIWRYDGIWTAEDFGSESSRGVRLNGTSDGLLWTEWSNGLINVHPDMSRWDLHAWDDIGANLSDWVFDVSPAPDGSAWFATRDGLAHFDGRSWEITPLPNNPLVTAVAVMPDDTIWVQTTDSSVMSWLPMIVVGLGLIFLLQRAGSWVMSAYS
jgi:hypothetical protein